MPRNPALVRNTFATGLGALGRFSEAFDLLREAIHIAEDAGHVYTLLFPLFGFGALTLDQGDFAGAVAPLERGLKLCRTREVPLLLNDFAWALGAAWHWTGRGPEGIALMEEAARTFTAGNQRWSLWAGRVPALGAAYLRDGRLADATRIAHHGFAAARQRGEQEAEGQLLRLLGDIAAHPDRLEAGTAEVHYHQAQAPAEALGRGRLLADCALGLGKLYRRTGKCDQGLEQLTTATTMYREMDMGFWLEQAEAEMKELG